MVHAMELIRIKCIMMRKCTYLPFESSYQKKLIWGIYLSMSETNILDSEAVLNTS